MTNSNVIPIEKPAAQPAAEFVIPFLFEGFSVTARVTGNLAQLRAMIEKLKAEGATPPQPSANLPNVEPTKPAGPPTCPVHNSAMKEGRRGFYCPKKVGDSYCREVG